MPVSRDSFRKTQMKLNWFNVSLREIIVYVENNGGLRSLKILNWINLLTHKMSDIQECNHTTFCYKYVVKTCVYVILDNVAPISSDLIIKFSPQFLSSFLFLIPFGFGNSALSPLLLVLSSSLSLIQFCSHNWKCKIFRVNKKKLHFTFCSTIKKLYNKYVYNQYIINNIIIILIYPYHRLFLASFFGTLYALPWLSRL